VLDDCEVALFEELEQLDRDMFAGALQLLKEAGITPSFAELMEATNRSNENERKHT
jgi:hypothetical protein